MEKNKKQILWITRTALLVALLVATQALTSSLGMQLLTGSLVNLILVISVMAAGLSSGIAVALISPLAAKLLGIGPLWSLIPFIMLGNCTLVILWHIVGARLFKDSIIGYISALAAASVGKYLVLYLGIVRIMIPMFLNLPEKQATVISATFSVTQLITALIGGALAILILPVLKKALRK